MRQLGWLMDSHGPRAYPLHGREPSGDFLKIEVSRYQLIQARYVHGDFFRFHQKTFDGFCFKWVLCYIKNNKIPSFISFILMFSIKTAILG